MRTCIVNLQTNLVENVIDLGASSSPNTVEATQPPAGYLWVQHDRAGPGWTFANGQLIAPPVPPPPPPTQDQLDAAAAKAYTKLAALMGMTPAQVQSWVQANVTNLSQAQDAIATLAIAVSVLARRL